MGEACGQGWIFGIDDQFVLDELHCRIVDLLELVRHLDVLRLLIVDQSQIGPTIFDHDVVEALRLIDVVGVEEE